MDSALVKAPTEGLDPELPRKTTLGREHYLMVQQLYRGWAWLGIVVVGALLSTGTVARLTRARAPSSS
jgi:hypothetical protein